MCKSSGGESMAGMVWEVEGGEAEGLGHRGPLARSKSVPNSHSGQWRRPEELQGRKSHVQVSVLRKSYFWDWKWGLGVQLGRPGAEDGGGRLRGRVDMTSWYGGHWRGEREGVKFAGFLCDRGYLHPASEWAEELTLGKMRSSDVVLRSVSLPDVFLAWYTSRWLSKVDKGSPFHSFCGADIKEEGERKGTILFLKMIAKAYHTSTEICIQVVSPFATGQDFLEGGRIQRPETLHFPLCSHFDKENPFLWKYSVE